MPDFDLDDDDTHVKKPRLSEGMMKKGLIFKGETVTATAALNNLHPPDTLISRVAIMELREKLLDLAAIERDARENP